jgi:hypothetical protein
VDLKRFTKKMKRITIGSIIVFIFLMGLVAGAQDCKVLVEEISIEYEGDCKKGLAHGKGIASGAGFIYEGEFKKGYPDGEGTLTIEENGKIFTGDWKRGEVYGEGELNENGNIKKGYFKGTISGFVYMGPEKADLAGYKIIEQARMENATIDFIHSDEMNNMVVIKIQENVIRQINNFDIISMTSGTLRRLDNSGGRLTAEIENVNYPITFRIQYVLPYGGLENPMAPVLLRFTISQTGLWTVNITHR